MAVSSAFSVAISSSFGLLFAAGLPSAALFGLCFRGRADCRRTVSLGERREQAERPLERGEILAYLLLHRLECGSAEGVGESAAILLLLAGERIEAELEIARHQLLHAVAVKADQLPQETDGQEVRPPAFLLDNDLCQDRMGEVFTGFGIVDDEVALAPNHFGQVLERHIGACVGIVEPAVRVFLDDDRPALLFGVPCHVSIAPTP